MEGITENYIKEKFPFRALMHVRGFKPQNNFFRRVATTYEKAKHDPYDPLVSEAYSAFKEEVVMQFQYMIERDGVTVKPWLDEGQPYINSNNMMAQIAATNTLYVFLTESGYGNNDAPLDHPMIEKSGIVIENYEFCYNDLFRAVHDYYCHYHYRYDFSIVGECKAALKHIELLTKTAARAVFSETVGQICWFYYGPHVFTTNPYRLPEKGEQEYYPPSIRPFPKQKSIILPECLMQQFHELFA